ncbi:F0F1 ATP synthase subunit delta [Candidatus Uhrbacteria bacterium]|nr:F0F1 ATP synthase subunit delta [Candidatus Uhrbacteria bacterium]
MKKPAVYWARLLYTLASQKTGEELTEALRVFVQHLERHNARSRWREIARAFEDVWRKEHGAATVELSSVEEPDRHWRDRLAKTFPGAEIRLTRDSELLGGAVLQIDDRRIDMTDRAKLKALTNFLTANV